MAVLAACSGMSQPFGKPEGEASQAEPTLPPGESFKKAGPGADNELDYETIYGPGVVAPDGAAVETADAQSTDQAVEPAPDQTTAKQPAGKDTGTKSAKTEIKAVAVVPVKGAPGKGNAELTDAMRKTLRSAGWPVIEEPRQDALTISGTVALTPEKAKAQNVSLSWRVTAFDGTVLGTIKQSNDVPAGSLDKSWGEAARYATDAGATGIFDLIKRYR